MNLKDFPITSPFGSRIHPLTGKESFHNGIDLRMPIGTPIYSPDSGIVVFQKDDPREGKQLIIEHDSVLKGYKTGYAHLDSWVLIKGDRVYKGQIIAYSGNSGQSTGPHLHFTVRRNGELINPVEIFEMI